jgi:chitodextrinase
MSAKSPALLAFVTLLLSAASPAQEGAARDPLPLLELGRRQVEAGEYADALFALDTAARGFKARPGSASLLAQAHFYLGWAYTGLDQEEKARRRFRDALQAQPAFRPAPGTAPARVMAVFDGVAVAAAAKRRGHARRTALLVGGGAGLAAVGISALTSDGGPLPNRQPASSIGVTPEGAAIAGVTAMQFEAVASDPDGDSLTYDWSFGDGGRASGRVATHVFPQVGEADVTLSVSDGHTAAVVTRRTVTVGRLDGIWTDNIRFSRPGGPVLVRLYNVVQNGSSFSGTVIQPDVREIDIARSDLRGRLSSPRQLALEAFEVDLGGSSNDPTTLSCVATVEASLREIRCTLGSALRRFVRQ